MTDEKELEGKDVERKGKGAKNPTKYQEKRRQGNLGRKTGCSGLLQPLCLKGNQIGTYKNKLQKIEDVLVINKGKDGVSKTDEFSEKFQKGGGGSFPIQKFMLQILDL